MPVTQSQVGTLYDPKWSGIAWSQPGGPNTTVYPQQNNGPFTDYPVVGQVFAESGMGLWRGPCGHGWDCFLVQRDYDPSTGESVAVICCPLCSLILNLIEPYESWVDPLTHPILVG